MVRIAVFSDIHANLTALNAVLKDCRGKYGDVKFIHLGDCVDYGMRPNETIAELKKIPFIVNIKGNHERAILGFEDERFSSPRGKEANNYTKSILNDVSRNYINSMSDGYKELELDGKHILFIHGDLNDIYWGKMKDDEIIKEYYQKYDFVISGHTHVSSLKTIINQDKTHKTIFVNPGSVGQPRNLNPNAQYCVIDFETASVDFNSVKYDVSEEQALYKGEIDEYYKNRLAMGL